MFLALKLSKAGYGSPMDILKWPVQAALDALDFEHMCTDYEVSLAEMNRDKGDE